MLTKAEKKRQKIQNLSLGGLFIALFAVASNLPVLSAIQLIPGIPLTLQVFLIALMALTLDLKSSMLTLTSLLLLTLCGLPLMTGGKGGPAALAGATSGYIYGWYLIVLLLGLYHDYGMKKLQNQKVWGVALHIPAAFLIGMAGIFLDYACGTLGVLLVGGTPLSAFGASYVAGLSFLPGDMIKIISAALLSTAFSRLPGLNRLGL